MMDIYDFLTFLFATSVSPHVFSKHLDGYREQIGNISGDGISHENKRSTLMSGAITPNETTHQAAPSFVEKLLNGTQGKIQNAVDSKSSDIIQGGAEDVPTTQRVSVGPSSTISKSSTDNYDNTSVTKDVDIGKEPDSTTMPPTQNSSMDPVLRPNFTNLTPDHHEEQEPFYDDAETKTNEENVNLEDVSPRSKLFYEGNETKPSFGDTHSRDIEESEHVSYESTDNGRITDLIEVVTTSQVPSDSLATSSTSATPFTDYRREINKSDEKRKTNGEFESITTETLNISQGPSSQIISARSLANPHERKDLDSPDVKSTNDEDVTLTNERPSFYEGSIAKSNLERHFAREDEEREREGYNVEVPNDKRVTDLNEFRQSFSESPIPSPTLTNFLIGDYDEASTNENVESILAAVTEFDPRPVAQSALTSPADNGKTGAVSDDMRLTGNEEETNAIGLATDKQIFDRNGQEKNYGWTPTNKVILTDVTKTLYSTTVFPESFETTPTFTKSSTENYEERETVYDGAIFTGNKESITFIDVQNPKETLSADTVTKSHFEVPDDIKGRTFLDEDEKDMIHTGQKGLLAITEFLTTDKIIRVSKTLLPTTVYPETFETGTTITKPLEDAISNGRKDTTKSIDVLNNDQNFSGSVVTNPSLAVSPPSRNIEENESTDNAWTYTDQKGLTDLTEFLTSDKIFSGSSVEKSIFAEHLDETSTSGDNSVSNENSETTLLAVTPLNQALFVGPESRSDVSESTQYDNTISDFDFLGSTKNNGTTQLTDVTTRSFPELFLENTNFDSPFGRNYEEINIESTYKEINQITYNKRSTVPTEIISGDSFKSPVTTTNFAKLLIGDNDEANTGIPYNIEDPELTATTPVREEPELTVTTPVRKESELTATTPVREEPELTTTTPVREEYELTAITPVREEPELTTTTPVGEELSKNPATRSTVTNPPGESFEEIEGISDGSEIINKNNVTDTFDTTTSKVASTTKPNSEWDHKNKENQRMDYYWKETLHQLVTGSNTIPTTIQTFGGLLSSSNNAGKKDALTRVKLTADKNDLTPVTDASRLDSINSVGQSTLEERPAHDYEETINVTSDVTSDSHQEITDMTTVTTATSIFTEKSLEIPTFAKRLDDFHETFDAYSMANDTKTSVIFDKENTSDYISSTPLTTTPLFIQTFIGGNVASSTASSPLVGTSETIDDLTSTTANQLQVTELTTVSALTESIVVNSPLLMDSYQTTEDVGTSSNNTETTDLNAAVTPRQRISPGHVASEVVYSNGSAIERNDETMINKVFTEDQNISDRRANISTQATNMIKEPTATELPTPSADRQKAVIQDAFTHNETSSTNSEVSTAPATTYASETVTPSHIKQSTLPANKEASIQDEEI